MKEINCPIWWKSSLEDVEQALSLVKCGIVKEIARSAGNRPIYMVEYGKSNVRLGAANCSSALGAHDINCFADKRGEDYVPTVFLAGCIHGGEFEGTVALLNLIKELETGTDYRGESHSELIDMISLVHLVIIPVCNPDGRSRIPFRSFVGRTFHDLRYYNQGTWKIDGTLCGWPGCKMVHPIKEASDFLGAYFNDDGINIMHEDFFGQASTETNAIFDICRFKAPDCSVLLHGGTNAVSGILEPDYISSESAMDIRALSTTLKSKADEAGMRYFSYGSGTISTGFTLPSAMHHLCGAMCLTYESNQGLADAPGYPDSAEDIYALHRQLFTEIARFVLNKFGKVKWGKEYER